jgi:hypothetical protein
MNAFVKYGLPMAAVVAGWALCAIAMRRGEHANDSIDAELEDSFPASDPPSWTRTTSTVPTGTGLD